MVDEENRDRLESLASRIAEAEKSRHASGRQVHATPEAAAAARARARAVRIGTDFIATVLGSLGLGWFADQQLDTAPWGMILLLTAGFISACWSLVKAFVPSGKEKAAEEDQADSEAGKDKG